MINFVIISIELILPSIVVNECIIERIEKSDIYFGYILHITDILTY